MQDSPNRELIGKAGGRDRLQTPCLVLDLDAAEANIAELAGFAWDRGIGLRPHGKAHKSVALARRQLAAGALGICAATLGEAEIFAEAGLPGVLLTSPLAGAAKLQRLAALARRQPGVMAVAESAPAVDALSAAMAGAATPLTLLLDLEIGQARTGIPEPAAAVALARRIAAAPGLRFGGVQGYAGHTQHVAGWAERRAALAAPMARLRAAVEALRAAGLPPGIVTGGGTGSHALDIESRLFTELQCGSYLFTDVQYDAVALRPDAPRPFRPSLFVAVAVVSAQQPGHVTTDGGLKRFATGGPAPLPLRNAPPGARYRFTGDEFGALSAEGALPAAGQVIECQVPHCDPNVDLYDWYHAVRGDRLVEILAVEGRGAI